MTDEEPRRRSEGETPWDYVFELAVSFALFGGVYLVSSLFGPEWHFLHYLAYTAIVVLAGCIGAAIVVIERIRNPLRPRREPILDNQGKHATEKPLPVSGRDVVIELILLLVLMGGARLASYIFEQESLLAYFLIFVGLLLVGIGVIALSRKSRRSLL